MIFESEDAGKWVEHYTETISQTWKACPFCGSTDVEEPVKCDACGELFCEEALISTESYRICPECYKAAQRIAAEIREKHGDPIADAVQQVLFDLIEN